MGRVLGIWKIKYLRFTLKYSRKHKKSPLVGLKRAGSSRSGRFVAPITNTSEPSCLPTDIPSSSASNLPTVRSMSHDTTRISVVPSFGLGSLRISLGPHFVDDTLLAFQTWKILSVVFRNPVRASCTRIYRILSASADR